MTNQPANADNRAEVLKKAKQMATEVLQPSSGQGKLQLDQLPISDAGFSLNGVFDQYTPQHNHARRQAPSRRT